MILGRGWSSNSLYSMLGTIRSVAQTISYEVRIALIFLCIVFFLFRFNLYRIFFSQHLIRSFYVFIPLYLCWLVSLLAETNRTPFDFSEGESELVSGYNVEYRRGGFTLLFLSEYARIIFMSYFLVLLFFGFNLGENGIFFYRLIGCFYVYWFIWVRGCLPRYRYDKLINLMWKVYLPVSLLIIMFYIIYTIILMSHSF